MMKEKVLLFLCLFLLATRVEAQEGLQNEKKVASVASPFKLSIQSDKEVYGPDDAVNITFTLENVSTEDQSFYKGKIDFDVTDAQGQFLETYSLHTSCSGFFSSIYPSEYFTLKPNETWGEKELLGHVRFDEIWDHWGFKGDLGRIFKYCGVVLRDERNRSCPFFYMPEKDNKNELFIRARYCPADPNPYDYDAQTCQKNQKELQQWGQGDFSSVGLGMRGIPDLNDYCQRRDFLSQPAWQGCVDAEVIRIQLEDTAMPDGKHKLEGVEFTKERLFKDGMLHGEAYDYYKTGEMAGEFVFESGKLNGDAKFYLPNGKLNQVMSFKDGQLDGAATLYFDDGTVEKQSLYKDGQQQGKEMFFRQTREGRRYLESVGIYVNGQKEGIFKIFNNQGNLKGVKNYKNGELDGKTQWFFSDGKLASEAVYEKGKGCLFMKSYYPNGQIKIEREYDHNPESATMNFVRSVKQYDLDGKLLLDHEYFCPENVQDNRKYDDAQPIMVSLFLDQIEVNPDHIQIILKDDFKQNIRTDDYKLNSGFRDKTLIIPRREGFEAFNPIFCFVQTEATKPYASSFESHVAENFKEGYRYYCLKLEKIRDNFAKGEDNHARFVFESQLPGGVAQGSSYFYVDGIYKSFLKCNGNGAQKKSALGSQVAYEGKIDEELPSNEFREYDAYFGGGPEASQLEDIIACEDDCEMDGEKMCDGNFTRTCGHYDEDACLEWGPLRYCPDNSICQNGECIAPDVEIHAGEVPRDEKPPVSGGLVCNGIYYKGQNIGCFNNKFYEAYPYETYTRAGWLCADDEDCDPEYPYCFDHTCRIDRPYYNLDIEINTPVSVPLETDFKVQVTLTNNNEDIDLDLSIDRVEFHHFIEYPLVWSTGGGKPDSRNPNETDFIIRAGETKEYEFVFNSGQDITFRAGVAMHIHQPRTSGCVQSQPIIVYDPQKPTDRCNDIMYNSRYAECYDDVLYIAGSGICRSEKDCFASSCFQRYCLVPGAFKEGWEPKGVYRGGLVALFLTDDESERQRQKKYYDIQKTADQANVWFQEEIALRKLDDFQIKFEPLECPQINYHAFFDILKSHEGAGHLTVFEDVAKLCEIDRNQYPLLGFRWIVGGGQNENELVKALHAAAVSIGGGANYYGKGLFNSFMGEGNQFPYVINTTMQAFGMRNFGRHRDPRDAGKEYIWRDCYLMGLKATSKYLSAQHVPLCDLEAVQAGWMVPPLAPSPKKNFLDSSFNDGKWDADTKKDLVKDAVKVSPDKASWIRFEDSELGFVMYYPKEIHLVAQGVPPNKMPGDRSKELRFVCSRQDIHPYRSLSFAIYPDKKMEEIAKDEGIPRIPKRGETVGQKGQGAILNMWTRTKIENKDAIKMEQLIDEELFEVKYIFDRLKVDCFVGACFDEELVESMITSFKYYKREDQKKILILLICGLAFGMVAIIMYRLKKK